MHPGAALAEARATKARLRGRIQAGRAELVRDVGHVLQPLHWIDAVVARWQRLPPATRTLVTATLAGGLSAWMARRPPASGAGGWRGLLLALLQVALSRAAAPREPGQPAPR